MRRRVKFFFTARMIASINLFVSMVFICTQICVIGKCLFHIYHICGLEPVRYLYVFEDPFSGKVSKHSFHITYIWFL